MKYDVNVSKYIGSRIKEYRKKRKLTQEQLGAKIGVKHNTVSSYESGTNEPEQNILFEIAKVLDVSINDLFPPTKGNFLSDSTTEYRIRNEHDIHLYEYTYFPVSVAAGLPEDIEGVTKDQVEKIAIPDGVMGKWARSKDVFFMKVNGESMNKVIPHESLIAVKHTDPTLLRDGDIVVYSDDYEFSVKRLYRDNDRFIFRPESTDKRFTDYIIPIDSSHSLKIHGRVVLYIVELN